MNRYFIHTIYRLYLRLPIVVSYSSCFLLCICCCLPLNISSQCVLVCNNQINTSIGNDGTRTISPDEVLENMPSDCTDGLEVQILDANDNLIGDMLTCEHVGQTLEIAVIDIATGNYCNGLISLYDAFPPVIECIEPLYLYCTAPTSPDSIGYPVVYDNCTPLDSNDLSYNDSYMDLDCFDSHDNEVVTGMIERMWSATDENGLTTTCVQAIYLKRALLSEVVFPEDRDGFGAPKLICGQDDYLDFELTGVPTIDGRPVDNMASICEIIIDYDDLVIGTCGNSLKILREWRAIDWCTNSSITELQIIDVVDNIAPVITCPASITLGSDPYDCSTTVTLPNATAIDGCSTYSITPSWDFGTGYGPFNDVPTGIHTVTYTAKDACSNESTCTITVTIQDDDPPTPVCETSLSVSLLPNGTARIYAHILDEGSYDNCGVDRVEVRRDGQTYSNYVDFTCDDVLNSPIAIDFQVVDMHEQANQCVININIDDYVFPTIDCPDDITIDCNGDDYENLMLTGTAIAMDNCTIDSLFYEDDMLSNTCGNATITRIWTAIDATGNSASCTQMITIEDSSIFSVDFPEDLSIDQCSGDSDPSFTGEPVLFGTACRSVGIDYDDQLFDAPNLCTVLIRTWTVIDWCTYDANSANTDGYYEHQQQIELADTTIPNLDCPQDITLGDDSNDCSGVLVNLALASANDCNAILTITNDSPYASANGADASGIYPLGDHLITYTATDGCGNMTTCTTNITVEDYIAPAVFCQSDFSISLMASGSVTVLGTSLDDGSTDNCTAVADLIFDVSPNVFTCNDIGVQNVTLTVTDESGNSGICVTTISIEDVNNACGTNTATIAGTIAMNTGEPVELVELQVDNSTASTDNIGAYTFSDLELGTNYEIIPEKDIYPLNGVSTYDIVLMQQHILGVTAFDSPYKMIAADVNNDGNITTFDVIQTRQLILYVITDFPAVNSWRFIDADYTFIDPSDPFDESFPESHTCQNLSMDENDIDFVAIKMGDVSGDVEPNEFGGNQADYRNPNKEIHFLMQNEYLEAGNTYRIPVRASNYEAIMGFQLGLHFEASAVEFIGIHQGDLFLYENNISRAYIAEGIILWSWNNVIEESFEASDTLFEIELYAKKTNQLADCIQPSSRYMQAEAYDRNLEIVDVDILVEGELTSIQPLPQKANVYQNYPNPFRTTSSILFELEQQSEVRLEVMDIQGRLCYQYSDFYPSGKHHFILNANDFPASTQLLFYTIKVDGIPFGTFRMLLTQ